MNLVTSTRSNAWFSGRNFNRFSLGALLTALCGLIASPNIYDPLVIEIAERYIQDYDGYCETAASYTAKYATGGRPSADSIILARDSNDNLDKNEAQISLDTPPSPTDADTTREIHIVRDAKSIVFQTLIADDPSLFHMPEAEGERKTLEGVLSRRLTRCLL